MNRLKELRQSKKQTQQEIADIVGVTKRTYIYWEQGERQIKPEKAKVLADYFGVTVGYLLGYNDEEKRPDIFTPREERIWHEFDYLQLSRTDINFYLYEDLRKKLDPNLLELIINYSFGDDEEKRLLREIARKFAKEHSVRFDEKSKKNDTQ